MTPVSCPNCGIAIVVAELRHPQDTDTSPRTPQIGSMFLCGNCGDVFRLEPNGLVPWVSDVPAHIARISSAIKMTRARHRAAGKAALN